MEKPQSGTEQKRKKNPVQLLQNNREKQKRGSISG